MSSWAASELFMRFPPFACCDSHYAVPDTQQYMFGSIMCIFPIKENWEYRQIKPVQDLNVLVLHLFQPL